jgi:GxxExxY protein
METLQEKELTEKIIGCAIEVHRILGPGLLESLYEKCLLRELELRGILALNQDDVRIEYKGSVFKETLKFDLLIDGCLLLELKAVQDVLPIHKAQLFSYMKLLDVPLGLLLNFHEIKLVDGLSRMILPGANQP